eukprot:scaffold315176_cov32-Tisochrysis_lutea.AAC.4
MARNEGLDNLQAQRLAPPRQLAHGEAAHGEAGGRVCSTTERWVKTNSSTTLPWSQTNKESVPSVLLKIRCASSP